MLKDIFRKRSPEEYVEVDGPSEQSVARLSISVEKLQSYKDTEKIQEKLRQGKVLLIKLKELRSKNLDELKRSITTIKRTCLALDGDIAGAGEDWLIASGKNARIRRETTTSAS